MIVIIYSSLFRYVSYVKKKKVSFINFELVVSDFVFEYITLM